MTMISRAACAASLFLLACGSSTGTAPSDGSTPDTEPPAPDAVVDAADTQPGPDSIDSDLVPDVIDDVSVAVDAAPDGPDSGVADADLTDTKADDAKGDVIDVSDSQQSAIALNCFPQKSGSEMPGPVYDDFNPVVGSHCLGTNHQDIVGIERVVFLGDSVTLGTPNDVHPTFIDNSHFFRNLLAEWLANHFGLDKGAIWDWGLWKAYDALYSGEPGKKESGDFRNCSKWGGRTDDLLEGGGQIGSCFPDGGSDKKTLIVFTMGGNDIAKLTQVGGDASPAEVAAGYPQAWQVAQDSVDYLGEALVWLKDPSRFPNGSFVVFANPYEFTDGTGDTDSCSPQSISIAGFGEIDVSSFGINVAELGGFNTWEKPEVQREIVVWMLEQYTKLAVDTQTDVVWLLEHFCGHGYVTTGPNADTTNQCYLGPDAALYFDITCTHPSDAGHQAISDMFKAVIVE